MFKNTTLYEYAEKVTSMKGMEGKIFKIVLNTRFIKDLITHLNTDEQLGKERIDSLGARLGTYSIFDEKGRGGQFINLNDTGDFWNSWLVDVKENGIVISADPFKEETNLFEEYGIDVLGLTDNNLQIFINEARKLFIQYYRKHLPIN